MEELESRVLASSFSSKLCFSGRLLFLGIGAGFFTSNQKFGPMVRYGLAALGLLGRGGAYHGRFQKTYYPGVRRSWPKLIRSLRVKGGQ